MYSKIDAMFWKDAKNKTLTDDERLLFLYVLTCPHRNMLGLFVLPIAYIEADLRWNTREDRVSDRVCHTLYQLKDKGYIEYNEQEEVILIKNYLKYNPFENSKQMKCATKLLPDIPATSLESILNSILISLKDESKSVEYNAGIDTLYNTLCDRVCHTSNSNSNSNSNSITTTNNTTDYNCIGNELKKENSVVVESEEKEIKTKQICGDIVYDYYTTNFGSNLTEYSRLFFEKFRNNKTPDDLLIYAMQLAIEKNKKTLAYVKGILENWEKADITSVLEAKQSTEEYKNKASKHTTNTKQYSNYEQRQYSSKELEELLINKQNSKEEELK